METWLSTSFEGGRHERRVEKIEHLIGQQIERPAAPPPATRTEG
jgi:hypothetical protein